jgi:hypothetical protein
MRWASPLVAAALALVVLLAGTGRSEADWTKLRERMSVFATRLKEWLSSQGEAGIQINAPWFDNLPELRTNLGPGIALVLKEELERAGVPLRPNAAFSLKGRLTRIPANGPVKDIKSLAIVMEILAGNDVPYRDNVRVAGKELVDMFRDANPDTTEILSTRFVKGPYAAEILVNGQPRRGRLRDGLPYVSLKPSDEYTIRLLNPTNQDALVWVGIDGISMFAFNSDPESDGKKKDYKVVVPARKNGQDGVVLAKGWYFHKGANGSRKFRITELPEKTAAYVKGASQSELGVITLKFWETSPGGSAARGVGTGLGDAFTEEWRTVKTVAGDLKATLSIRYDKE